LHQIPTDTIIQRHTWLRFPAVLQKSRGVLVPAIECLRVRLVVIACDPDEEVCEIQARFGAEERKGTIECRVGVYINLFVTELSSCFKAVRAKYFRKIV